MALLTALIERAVNRLLMLRLLSLKHPPDLSSKSLIYIKILRRVGFDPLFGPLKGSLIIINSVR